QAWLAGSAGRGGGRPHAFPTERAGAGGRTLFRRIGTDALHVLPVLLSGLNAQSRVGEGGQEIGNVGLVHDHDHRHRHPADDVQLLGAAILEAEIDVTFPFQAVGSWVEYAARLAAEAAGTSLGRPALTPRRHPWHARPARAAH